MRRLSALRRGSGTGSNGGGGDDAEPGDQDKDPRVAQQKKTFRRWCNSFLKQRNLEIKHILNDWNDGVMLIQLMEILATTSLGKHNKPPITLDMKKGENLNLALNFIAKNVKLVNVGTNDIKNGNQTIILGLLWTLILRWGLKLTDGKAGLIKWVNERIGDKFPTNNLTTDWSDGMRFAALVNAHNPNLLDLGECGSDPVENMNMAFAAAEEHMAIPRLLDPQDVRNNPDEKSVMAYVGQFFNVMSQDDGPGKKTQPSAGTPVAPEIHDVTLTTCGVKYVVPKGTAMMRVQLRPVSSVGEPWPLEEPGAMEKSVPKSTSSTSFEGLSPNTPHQVRLIAVGANGKESPPSALAEFNTLEVRAESPPRVLNLQPTSCDVVSSIPAGAAFLRCEIVPISGPTPDASTWEEDVAKSETTGGVKTCELEGKTREVTSTVDGLTPGHSYRLRAIPIIAKKDGSVGSEGTPSEEVIFTTTEMRCEAPRAVEVGPETLVLTVALPIYAQAIRFELRSADGSWDEIEPIVSSDAVGLPPSSSKTAAAAASGKTATATFKGLIPASEYIARACLILPDGVSTSEMSSETEVVTARPDAPDAPTLTNVTGTTLDVEWTPVRGALKYKILIDLGNARAGVPPATRRSSFLGRRLSQLVTGGNKHGNGEASPPTRKEEFEVGVTSTTITGLPPGTLVAVRVVAETKAGDTDPGTPAEATTLKLSAPTRGPTLTDVTQTSMEVEFDPIPGCETYIVMVGTNDGEPAREEKTNTTKGNKVEGLDPGTPYTVRIVGVAPNGDTTEPGPPTQVTTQSPSMDLPVVDDVKTASARVTFTPLPNAARHKVQVREVPRQEWGPDCQEEEIPISETNALVVDELAPGKTHEVRVVAVYPDGRESMPSEAVSFTTDPAEDRIALVTGANSSAGVDVVRELLENLDSNKWGKFARIFACTRNAPIRELKELAENFKDVVTLIELDVLDKNSVKAAAKLINRTGEVHLIINNANLGSKYLAMLMG